MRHPVLNELICQLQPQPTDHSRAKYGSRFLHAHYFCSYLRTDLNHLPASPRRYPRPVSAEDVRYVELDYLCHNVSSSRSPLVKAERRSLQTAFREFAAFASVRGRLRLMPQWRGICPLPAAPVSGTRPLPNRCSKQGKSSGGCHLKKDRDNPCSLGHRLRRKFADPVH